ncbi:hypothetical protein CIPAW_03G103100 [Carya illinoinensis]|uniref:Uncharacterized protein n=1 Tax=Carya illinoinensis TaxID=32201 RepID=A0A8T1R125_CARIL|nr:hypothetical protein CIPAW_03G103100 [Carya illinoinensis]
MLSSLGGECYLPLLWLGFLPPPNWSYSSNYQPTTWI